MFSDLILIFYVWLISLILQAVSFPLLRRVSFKYLYDAGWGISRLVSWLVGSLLIWFVAHARIPLNTQWGVYGLYLTLLGLSVYYALKHPQPLIKFFVKKRALILTQEILFIIGLFGLSLIRAHNPAILDLEKFMDAGFMASYLRSATLPAPDMWLAGETINYYSFGHFMGSVMTRLWNLPISYSYNLLLAFIMGLGLVQSFSFVANLLAGLSRKPKAFPLILGGLLAAFLVVIAGNTHTIWFYLSKGTFTGYWYADATRFIHNTIHEFPSYSFVVSDIHGHVWDFPVVLAFLAGYLIWFKVLKPHKPSRPLILISAMLGITLGVMVMTNMWDFMIYGLLTALTGFVLFMVTPELFIPLVVSALTMLVSAGLTALPFALNFTSISEGAALVTERSPLWQLFALWTGHVSLTLLAMLLITAYLIFKKTGTRVKLFLSHPLALVFCLVLTAWVLLLLPEVIYIKDIYSGHPRANTMFKLTYQAFIMMSLVGGWVLGFVWKIKLFDLRPKVIVSVIIFAFTISMGLFPYFAYRDYYGALKTYKGLNGWTWLKDQYPDDYQVVLWLNQNVPGQPVILESWGESYTTFDRVSAYTGLPTVIGWRVHEWLWRGGFDIPGARSADVDTIYKEPHTPKARDLLNRYQVEYIVVGAKEREAYPGVDLTPLNSLGQVVFQSGDTFIIQHSLSNASMM